MGYRDRGAQYQAVQEPAWEIRVALGVCKHIPDVSVIVEVPRLGKEGRRPGQHFLGALERAEQGHNEGAEEEYRHHDQHDIAYRQDDVIARLPSLGLDLT